MNTAQAYDLLADQYHLIFENWDSSIERQATALSAILKTQCNLFPGMRILDCACGIGTQSIGLAQQGFQITGSDISPGAIARARREVSGRGLSIPLYVADMCNLAAVDGTMFDGLLCMDNSIPHLTDEEQLLLAARQFRAKLRPGGALIASIRDYDRLLDDKPTMQLPSFFTDADDRRRIVFQVWDWLDERQYMFHLFITRGREDQWETFHTSALYRGIRRSELSDILLRAGFRGVRWLFPQETEYYQPIVIATAD